MSLFYNKNNKDELLRDVLLTDLPDDVFVQNIVPALNKALQTDTVNPNIVKGINDAYRKAITTSKSVEHFMDELEIFLGKFLSEDYPKYEEMKTKLGNTILDAILALEKTLSEGGIQFYDSFMNFPEIGDSSKIYIDKTENTLYLWDGLKYIKISGGVDIHLSNRSPNESDNSNAGFDIGKLWINQSDDRVYILVRQNEEEDEDGNTYLNAIWVCLNEEYQFKEWKPNEAYHIGSVVIYNNRLYRSNTAHVSSNNFSDDANNWDIIGSGGGTYIASEILVNEISALNIPDTNVQNALEIIADFVDVNKLNIVNVNTKVENLMEEVDEIKTNVSDHEQRLSNIESGQFDEKVKASESDPESGYLVDKIDNESIVLDVDSQRIKAKKLDGQIVTIEEINRLSGVTSNIQEQIDALGVGLFWQDEVETYADLLQIENPSNGWAFVVSNDETKNGARTFYVYNHPNWIFLGDLSFINDASDSVKGIIKLAGDLKGTADNPQLVETGVIAGAYSNPIINVDSKGRITFASNGSVPSAHNSIQYQVYFPPEERQDKRVFKIPDYTPNSNTLEVYIEGVRVFKDAHYIEVDKNTVEFLFDIKDEWYVGFVNAKWDRGYVGTKEVDENNILDGRILAYDASTNKLKYVNMPSGKFIELQDTPNSFEGQGGKILAVNSLENGIEFINPPSGGGSGVSGGVRVGETVLTGLYELVPSNNIKFSVNSDDKKITVNFNLDKWGTNKQYKQGEMVWVQSLFGNKIYVCKINHTSSFDFEVDKDYWEEVGGSGGGGVPTFKEITADISVIANSSNFVSLNAYFDKYDLRTISAISAENQNIKVSVFDKSNKGDLVYESLIRPQIYDIVNVPIEDKDNSKKIHVLVENLGNEDTIVYLKIKVTNLI